MLRTRYGCAPAQCVSARGILQCPKANSNAYIKGVSIPNHGNRSSYQSSIEKPADLTNSVVSISDTYSPAPCASRGSLISEPSLKYRNDEVRRRTTTLRYLGDVFHVIVAAEVFCTQNVAKTCSVGCAIENSVNVALCMDLSRLRSCSKIIMLLIRASVLKQ